MSYNHRLYKTVKSACCQGYAGSVCRGTYNCIIYEDVQYIGINAE